MELTSDTVIVITDTVCVYLSLFCAVVVWSTISKVISPPSKKEYPEFFNINNTKIYDKNKIANSFNQFFTNIGHNLADQISTDSNLNYGDFLLDKTESRLHFETVSEDYVSKLIKKLPNKSSCGYDNISLKLIKYLNTLITPPITTIINQMINIGIFPDSLKIAKVKPIFKKNDTYNKQLSPYITLSISF